MNESTVEILLVEDNANDEQLALHAFRKHHLANKVHVVRDGAEALEFVFRTGQYADAAAGGVDVHGRRSRRGRVRGEIPQAKGARLSRARPGIAVFGFIAECVAGPATAFMASL